MQLTRTCCKGCPDIPKHTHKQGKQDVQYFSLSSVECTTYLERAVEVHKARKRTVNISGVVQDRASRTQQS